FRQWDDLIQKVSRLAAAKLDLPGFEIRREQVLDNVRPVFELLVAAAVLEYLEELRFRRAFRKNLVMDAPQEGFVHELARPDVRREDNQRHERNVEFLPGLQRQEIDPAL